MRLFYKISKLLFAPESSKKYYLQKARENSHLPIAQQILKRHETGFLVQKGLSEVRRIRKSVPKP